MRIHCNSLNYMYDNCVHCKCVVLCPVLCAFSVEVSMFCSVCCIYVCLCLCVCILCAYCVQVYVCIVVLCAYILFEGALLRMCYFLCVCVCVCVGGVRLRLLATQSDTPLYGYLCGHSVRIIKYKKTQP